MQTANLTVVFVAMDEFAERMARLSYDDQAALAAVFEALTVPVARRYGGRKVKTIQESQLFTFPSPTAALKAAAAIQDRAGRYGKTAPDELAVRLRVGVASGEVRVFEGDVYGEPVNLAARVKALAGSGEVLLTSGVHLSMNRAEVATEPVGKRTFKGVPEPVDVHRLSCVAGSDDSYGGATLDPLRLPDLDADDAHALASGWLSWKLYRLKRSLLEKGRGRPGAAGLPSAHTSPRAPAPADLEVASSRTPGGPLPAIPAEATHPSTSALERLSRLRSALRPALGAALIACRRNARVLCASAAFLAVALIIFMAARESPDRGPGSAPLEREAAVGMLPELTKKVAESPDDIEAQVALAHALARAGRREAAIRAYLRAANEDPGALQGTHIEDLVELLPVHGEATGDVEAALRKVGRPSIGPLQGVFENEERSRYHRRRAGQVLIALGRDVDLVPIWMETLRSSECAARVLAARELARLGDERAIPALRDATREGCLRGRSAARRALETLER